MCELLQQKHWKALRASYSIASNLLIFTMQIKEKKKSRHGLRESCFQYNML